MVSIVWQSILFLTSCAVYTIMWVTIFTYNPVGSLFWCANVIWKCFVKSLFVPLLLRLNDSCSSHKKPVLFDCFRKKSRLEHIQKTCSKSSWCTHYVVVGDVYHGWCTLDAMWNLPFFSFLGLITFDNLFIVALPMLHHAFISILLP